MRIWVVVAVFACASSAWGDPPSPRGEALAKQLAAKERGSEDTFWKQLATEGTPIVEDVHDPKGRLLVTFVFRAKPGVTHVAAYNMPIAENRGYVQLDRIPNSNTFKKTFLVDPTARFDYFFAPGDDFGPLAIDASAEEIQSASSCFSRTRSTRNRTA